MATDPVLGPRMPIVCVACSKDIPAPMVTIPHKDLKELVARADHAIDLQKQLTDLKALMDKDRKPVPPAFGFAVNL